MSENIGDGLQQGDPGNTVDYSFRPTIAGSYYVGDVPWQYMPPLAPYAQPTLIQWVPPLTEDRVREIVAEMLDKLVEERVHAALDTLAREANENKAFQPVIVDKHKTDPMLPVVHTPDGTCWACGGFGESAEMMWLDQFGRRSHLIHNTDECIRAAQSKPEQREHRG